MGVETKIDHIYSNGTNNSNSLNFSSIKNVAPENSFRKDPEKEMCSIMLGCDISSSTSGVDTSTAGSSSYSDSNAVDGKNRDCNESGLSSERFEEHSTSL